jgi:ABC-2 type transport system permease protein
MSRNLFIREMKFNILSLTLWTTVISILIAVTMSVFPTFIENQSKVLGMINLIPKSALEFKGVSNINDLSSVLGFYSVNNIIYMMVLGSIFSIVLSCNILLKEEYNKTAEYLLTRPLSRSSVFLTKLMVILLLVFLLNFITALAGYISMKLAFNGDFNIWSFLILSFYTFLLNLLFVALGIFISVFVKKAKPVTTLGIGLVLFFYFLFTISKITAGVSDIGYLSPFKFVRTDVMSDGYSLDLWRLLYFAGSSMVLLFIALKYYQRKDIYI